MMFVSKATGLAENFEGLVALSSRATIIKAPNNGFNLIGCTLWLPFP